VSRSLASAPHAGFSAAAAGILGKLPARCGLSALACQRWFVELDTAARRRMISASRERLGEDCVLARPDEAVPRLLPVAELCGSERHLPVALAEDPSGTDPRPRFHQSGRLRPAAEHAGFDALDRELDRRQPATPLAAAVFGISPGGDPEPLKLYPARPLWWTEGTPRVPFAPLAMSVKPGEAFLAGMPDVRASVPQAARLGLL
jgi:hypothetical protein